MTTPTRGRPPKPEEERFTHYDYVRMTKKQYQDVDAICEHLGYHTNGGHAAAIRFAIERFAKLIPKRSNK